MTLSTHVLDTARGVPAEGVSITLFAVDGEERRTLAAATTNADGRTSEPLGIDLAPGMYELLFATGVYFARSRTRAFYAEIPIRFIIEAEGGRYHVPLLISPWGYSTYRGS